MGRIVAAWLLAGGALATPLHAASDGDRVVLPFDQAKALLAQCSRSAPPLGQQGWTPSSDDIARFEKALLAAFARTGASHPFLKAPNRWLRQYVGMIRNGHRVIYGNFFPTGSDGEYGDWRGRAVAVCDGGSAFFGAEFDADLDVITDLQFNGYP